MKHDKYRSEHIDTILNSLDGIKQVEVLSFFYTRVSARMQLQQVHQQAGWIGFISKPAFAIAILLVLVAANGLEINQLIKQNKTEMSNTASIQNFAKEYGLSSASIY